MGTVKDSIAPDHICKLVSTFSEPFARNILRFNSLPWVNSVKGFSHVSCDETQYLLIRKRSGLSHQHAILSLKPHDMFSASEREAGKVVLNVVTPWMPCHMHHASPLSCRFLGICTLCFSEAVTQFSHFLNIHNAYPLSITFLFICYHMNKIQEILEFFPVKIFSFP